MFPCPLVLGSSSRWRKAVIEERFGSGCISLQLAPDIDEKAVRHEDPGQCALLVARAKMEALYPAVVERTGEGKEAILVCADQTIGFEGKVREKPRDAKENVEYLQNYGPGRPAVTHSALVVAHIPSGRREEGVDEAEVQWGEIPEDVIEKVVAKGDTLTCAGGFVMEDPDLSPHIVAVRGDADSVQGMPLALLARLIDNVTKPP
eukprot:Hpha_TRINITY_DN34429_c0_g1::TRINITY_DN34429_c0_g1_i1::g.96237::m.96237/K06287/maf; septum formation protein